MKLKCILGGHSMRKLAKLKTDDTVTITYWGGKKDEIAFDIDLEVCVYCRQVFLD